MSSTGGGGGGGGGGSAFFRAADGFFTAVPLPDLGFELGAAGFFAAGFDGAGSAATLESGTHAIANAAASSRARDREASMGGDSTRPRAGPHNLRWNRVSTVKRRGRKWRSSPAPRPASGSHGNM